MNFSSFDQLHYLPLPTDLFWSIIILCVFLILCSTSLSSPPSRFFLKHYYPLCISHPLHNFIIFPSLLMFSEASLSSVYFSSFTRLHYLPLHTDLFWSIISLRVFLILSSTLLSSAPYWTFSKHHYPLWISHPLLNFIIFPSLRIFSEASFSSVSFSSFAQLHYLPFHPDLFFLKHHYPPCISHPLLNFIIFPSLLIFSEASLSSVYFSSFTQLHYLPLPTDLFWSIIILCVIFILCSTSLTSKYF